MKKFFKALALVLALALVIGVVPAQATSAKIKAKKTLYVDGAKGTSTDGKLTSSYKSRVAIYKLAGDKKSVAKDHTYKAVIKSGDSVTKTKKYVYAADLGKSVVEIFKDGESLGTSVITVKKNATDDTLTITEFEDGKEVVCGVEYTVTLPRKGVDTDERRLFVDGEKQDDVEGQARVYKVTFKKSGDHKIKYEAFQSEELDAATATNEITVKAVMPKAVSAKQVSATSFEATFEGSMEGLIAEKDITNDMIYYLIADKPVVTGVVKSVKVEGAVVTVEMYSKFNDATTYYFAYGDGDAVSFKTAANKASEVAKIEIDKTQTFNVEKTTAVKYYLKNADGVILDLAEKPSFTVTAGTAGWFTSDNNIYFFEAGKVNIKATFATGEFDETTGKYVEVEDTATIEGVVASTTKTGTKYSLGAINDEIHQIRMKSAAATLTVKYTYSDGDPVTLHGDDTGYSLKSVNETIVAIQANKIVPVNPGTTTVVLYKGDDVIDAFSITVLEANKGATASVKVSKNTLNANTTLAVAGGTAGSYVDQIDLEYTVKDLDGQDYSNYTVKFTQVPGNEQASAAGIALTLANNTTVITGSAAAFSTIGAGQFKTFRMQVEITDNGNNNASLYKTVINFTVGNEATPNAYKLNATKNALDVSIKNWDDKDPLQSSKITVVNTKTTNYGDFACGTSDFDVISSLSTITATKGGHEVHNYVIYNKPTDDGQVTTGNKNDLTIAAFIGQPNLGANKAKTGTYTFSGYHVEYNLNSTTGVYEQANKSSLSTVSVVVSGSDATAKATVINGKASDLSALGVVGADSYEAVSGLSDLIQVSWEGLTSLKTTDTDFANSRVKIVGITAVKDNSGANKFYVRSVKVQLFVSKKTGCTTYYGEKTVDVNELFKD